MLSSMRCEDAGDDIRDTDARGKHDKLRVMGRMHPVDLLLMALYFVGMLWVGVWVMRSKKDRGECESFWNSWWAGTVIAPNQERFASPYNRVDTDRCLF